MHNLLSCISPAAPPSVRSHTHRENMQVHQVTRPHSEQLNISGCSLVKYTTHIILFHTLLHLLLYSTFHQSHSEHISRKESIWIWQVTWSQSKQQSNTEPGLVNYEVEGDAIRLGGISVTSQYMSLWNTKAFHKTIQSLT